MIFVSPEAKAVARFVIAIPVLSNFPKSLSRFMEFYDLPCYYNQRGAPKRFYGILYSENKEYKTY